MGKRRYYTERTRQKNRITASSRSSERRFPASAGTMTVNAERWALDVHGMSVLVFSVKSAESEATLLSLPKNCHRCDPSVGIADSSTPLRMKIVEYILRLPFPQFRLRLYQALYFCAAGVITALHRFFISSFLSDLLLALAVPEGYSGPHRKKHFHHSCCWADSRNKRDPAYPVASTDHNIWGQRLLRSQQQSRYQKPVEEQDHRVSTR